jgi:hypothetical protein
MKAYTQALFVPKSAFPYPGLVGLREAYRSYLKDLLPFRHRVVRFVITRTTDQGYDCEVDLLVPDGDEQLPLYFQNSESIFEFRQRTSERTERFTAVMLIPTGIGAELGGHCGDGNAAARLLASACDDLVTHPNVVNASDINEMTENALYVEGSVVTRLMTGAIGLQKVRSNRLLMLMDQHPEQYFNDEVINSVSSARISLGLDCDVHTIQNPADAVSLYAKSGRAVGEIRGVERLLDTVERTKNDYDAVAFSTLVSVPDGYHESYFHEDAMVNPWGGIEAMLTHSVAEAFKIPCAHSPLPLSQSLVEFEPGVVDPRKAPETASVVYLHCILKGLHRAPRIVPADQGLSVEDVSCLVVPDGCVGLPTLAALENGIPVIAVRENRNMMQNDLSSYPFRSDKLFIVDNYLEAAGVMAALRAGVSPQSVRRPLAYTNQI